MSKNKNPIDDILFKTIPKKGLSYAELMGRIRACASDQDFNKQFDELLKRTINSMAAALDIERIDPNALRYRISNYYDIASVSITIPSIASERLQAILRLRYFREVSYEEKVMIHEMHGIIEPAWRLCFASYANFNFETIRLTPYRRRVLLGEIT